MLTFPQFQSLVKYVREWFQLFQRFDADRSGSIDAREMKNALQMFGYNVSDKIIQFAVRKYDVTGNMH